jgi:simple sugar transport system permease protein
MKKTFSNYVDYVVLVIFLVIGTLFFFIYTSRLPLHILTAVPEFAIMCIGLTLLMICGEIDLSIGAIYFLGPVLVWKIWTLINNSEIAFILTFIICAVIGLVNGLIVIKFKIPSMISTLAMMFILRAVAVMITGGRPAVFRASAHPFLHTVLVGGSNIVPNHLIWAIALAVVFWLLLRRTRFGNWVLFTGSNERAAIDCGINTGRVKIICFVLCTLMATLGGLMVALRTGFVQITSNEFEIIFLVVASVVIGGTSLFGGKGSILGGGILGIFSIIMLRIVLASLGIIGWYRVLLGIIIVAILVGQGWTMVSHKHKHLTGT